jgi:hypothetical protein
MEHTFRAAYAGGEVVISANLHNAITGSLILVGLSGHLLAAVPIVFLVFLERVGLTSWRKRANIGFRAR